MSSQEGTFLLDGRESSINKAILPPAFEFFTFCRLAWRVSISDPRQRTSSMRSVSEHVGSCHRFSVSAAILRVVFLERSLTDVTVRASRASEMCPISTTFCAGHGPGHGVPILGYVEITRIRMIFTASPNLKIAFEDCLERFMHHASRLRSDHNCLKSSW